MVWGALLGAGASALLDRESAEDAAAFNARMAREQMAFQERMRNTQYQASAADLQKAGLNRVLALGSPAASPGGATATMPDAKMGTSAVHGASAYSAYRVNRAQEKLLGDQSLTQKSQTALNDVNSAKAQAETLKALTEIDNLGATREQIEANTKYLGAQTALADENARLARAEVAKQEVLKGVYEAVGPYAKKFFSDAPGLIDKAGSAAKDFLVGAGEDIILGPGRLWDKVSNSAKDALDKVKKFRFFSPKKGVSGDW